ncbi:hypothetical protein M5E87_16045 [Flavonifractor plautii]|nr:hypothetical protein M5E87_16045 [Flavonifractor plautii]
MDMGSRRMQIVGIVLAVLMAAMLAVTWAYRPVSLAEAADARTGLEPKVVVVVRLDEMDGNGTSHEYQAYDPALLEQMELLVDTAQLRLVRRSSIAPWTACVRSSSSVRITSSAPLTTTLQPTPSTSGTGFTRSAPPSRSPSPS